MSAASRLGGTVAALLLAAVALPTSAVGEEVIALTRVGCQFLESEQGIDRGYRPASSADCDTINARTSEERLAGAVVLELEPGRHVFRVTNANVPYPLGFWLRGDGVLNRATLPSVSGGGLVPETSRDYVIDLVPGEYVYSYPLNPTPDYKLLVRG